MGRHNLRGAKANAELIELPFAVSGSARRKTGSGTSREEGSIAVVIGLI